ncbi:hypothetical protein K493DRAFT_312930 [Basidiobolus meristosporus CBS 931.73]|uniref:YtxH domain-containing protein n=1 Tax=Basidiobolus meristosporus CBS 931.73 TaxID=1314790 RepID=A0A1Y1WQA7_9FUNG|nr:hypothetical protein K493DRAFT_321697 [Basidiobolus meristosporus CBS 931.73]ORY00122.1 hypothetical protein K493DRAFT_312930 [Basidiobolus meristosporus CBS 931.73]|eukprot:ORX75468.1 hypothetical protein K493DRAFT_321697 [Basidiobolus meristosporus CBS 931.73]
MAGGVGVLSGLYIFGPPLEHMAREAQEAHDKALKEQGETFEKVRNNLKEGSAEAKNAISNTASDFKQEIKEAVQKVTSAKD